MSAKGVASPVVAKGKVIAGFSDGYLVAVDLNNGKELWVSDLGADLSGAVDVDATPVIVDDRVFTGAFAAGPTCLSIDDGSVIWTSKYFGISKVDYSMAIYSLELLMAKLSRWLRTQASFCGAQN